MILFLFNGWIILHLIYIGSFTAARRCDPRGDLSGSFRNGIYLSGVFVIGISFIALIGADSGWHGG